MNMYMHAFPSHVAGLIGCMFSNPDPKVIVRTAAVELVAGVGWRYPF